MGGTAILRRHKLTCNITPVELSSNRVCTIPHQTWSIKASALQCVHKCHVTVRQTQNNPLQ